MKVKFNKITLMKKITYLMSYPKQYIIFIYLINRLIIKYFNKKLFYLIIKIKSLFIYFFCIIHYEKNTKK